MANKKPKDDREEKTSRVKKDRKTSKKDVIQKDLTDKKPVLSDSESHKELSEHEVFTGDEDFYKLLSDSLISESKKSTGNHKSLMSLNRHRPFTLLQNVIVFGIGIITIILLYALFGLRSGPISGPTPI